MRREVLIEARAQVGGDLCAILGEVVPLLSVYGYRLEAEEAEIVSTAELEVQALRDDLAAAKAALESQKTELVSAAEQEMQSLRDELSTAKAALEAQEADIVSTAELEAQSLRDDLAAAQAALAKQETDASLARQELKDALVAEHAQQLDSLRKEHAAEREQHAAETAERFGFKGSEQF